MNDEKECIKVFFDHVSGIIDWDDYYKRRKRPFEIFAIILMMILTVFVYWVMTNFPNSTFSDLFQQLQVIFFGSFIIVALLLLLFWKIARIEGGLFDLSYFEISKILETLDFIINIHIIVDQSHDIILDESKRSLSLFLVQMWNIKAHFRIDIREWERSMKELLGGLLSRVDYFNCRATLASFCFFILIASNGIIFSIQTNQPLSKTLALCVLVSLFVTLIFYNIWRILLGKLNRDLIHFVSNIGSDEIALTQQVFSTMVETLQHSADCPVKIKLIGEYRDICYTGRTEANENGVTRLEAFIVPLFITPPSTLDCVRANHYDE